MNTNIVYKKRTDIEILVHMKLHFMGMCSAYFLTQNLIIIMFVIKSEIKATSSNTLASIPIVVNLSAINIFSRV